MAYKCLSCGHIFEEGEQARWEEAHGLDTPPYEQWSGCPLCKGAYEETERCAICGGEFLRSELAGCVCDECLYEYKNDFEMCKKIAGKETEKIELNILLTSFFDKGDIEAILFDYIKNHCQNETFEDFINQDKSWFAERLVELQND